MTFSNLLLLRKSLSCKAIVIHIKYGHSIKWRVGVNFMHFMRFMNAFFVQKYFQQLFFSYM